MIIYLFNMPSQSLHNAVLQKVESILSGQPFLEIRIKPSKSSGFLVEVMFRKEVSSEAALSDVLQRNGFEDLRIVTEKGRIVYAALLKKYRIAL